MSLVPGAARSQAHQRWSPRGGPVMGLVNPDAATAQADRRDSPTYASPAAAGHAEAPGPHRDALARNAAYLLLGQVAFTALSIVLNAALGRTLGATDFGVYFLLVSMSTFAYVFVDWGQSAYLIREAAQRPHAIGTLLGSALVFRGLAAAAATVLTTLVARLLGYDPRIQALGALMVVCSLPLALSQPYTYLFRGRDRMDLDAIVTVAARGLTVVVTLPALLLGGRLVSVIVALGLGGAGALAIAVVLGHRLRLARPQPTRDGVRELAFGGASIAVFFAAIAVQPYIDAIVLSKLAPGSAVGWYGAAKSIMGVLTAPASILAAAAFPQLSRVAADLPELRSAIRTALRPVIGLGTLGAVGTFLFASVAVSLIYGRAKFGPSAAILGLFAPMMLLFYVDMLFGTVVTAIGKTRVLALAKLASVAVSTVLGVLLVPPCQERFGNGGLGIVVAFGTSEIVMLAAYLWVVPHRALDGGALLDLGRAILAGVGTLALFRVLPPLSPWLAMPGAVGAFAVLTWAVGLTTPADLSQIGRLVRRRLGKEPASGVRS